jgi:hypothetical protein
MPVTIKTTAAEFFTGTDSSGMKLMSADVNVHSCNFVSGLLTIARFV